MNKYFFIALVFSLISCYAYGQSGNKIVAEDYNELLEIAKQYVLENPDDSEAEKLLNTTLGIQKEYYLHLDQLTGGTYSVSDIGEKTKVERETNNKDPKAQYLSKAFTKSFRSNNEYFPTVSTEYKNLETENRLKKRAMKSKKQNIKNRKKKMKKN